MLSLTDCIQGKLKRKSYTTTKHLTLYLLQATSVSNKFSTRLISSRSTNSVTHQSETGVCEAGRKWLELPKRTRQAVYTCSPFLDRGNIVALYVCKYDTNVWLCQYSETMFHVYVLCTFNACRSSIGSEPSVCEVSVQFVCMTNTAWETLQICIKNAQIVYTI